MFKGFKFVSYNDNNILLFPTLLLRLHRPPYFCELRIQIVCVVEFDKNFGQKCDVGISDAVTL